MRIVGRSYGRAAKGSGLSSIIKNTKPVGATIPPWSYGNNRTCEHTVTVDKCSKPNHLDSPTAGQRAYRTPRKTGSIKSIITNARELGTTVFPAKADHGLECNVYAVDNSGCSKADNVATPQVVQNKYGIPRQPGAYKSIITNSRAVGTTVFPANADGRLTCRSYVNAHLR